MLSKENKAFIALFRVQTNICSANFQGETKGKEIDLKAILAVNPTLAMPPPSTSSSMNPIPPVASDENHVANEFPLKSQNEGVS